MADSSKNPMSTAPPIPAAGSAGESAWRPVVISFKDIVFSLRILLSLPVAWIVPARHWPVFSRVVARAAFVLPLQRRRRSAQRIDLILASSDNEARKRQVLFDSFVERQINLFNILRAHRPGGWQPAIRIDGEDNIHGALAQNRGVILWYEPFIQGRLMMGKALHDAGFAVNYLSRPVHGFSDTRFGMSVLNPILINAETRSPARRVVISPDEGGSAAALANLRDVIADNGIVAIVVADQARRTEDIPFLGGRVRIATGPIHLARTTGAALLPVFTCHDDSGVFHVNVGRELREPDTGAGSDVYRKLAEAYFQRLEPYVVRHPSQWNGEIRPADA